MLKAVLRAVVVSTCMQSATHPILKVSLCKVKECKPLIAYIIMLGVKICRQGSGLFEVILSLTVLRKVNT